MKSKEIKRILYVYLGGLLMFVSCVAAFFIVPGTIDENNVRHISGPWTICAFLLPVVLGIIYANIKSILKHLKPSTNHSIINEDEYVLDNPRDTFIGSAFVLVSFFFVVYHESLGTYVENEQIISVDLTFTIVLIPISVAIIYAERNIILASFSDMISTLFAWVPIKTKEKAQRSRPVVFKSKSSSQKNNTLNSNTAVELQTNDDELDDLPRFSFSSFKEFLLERSARHSLFFNEDEDTVDKEDVFIIPEPQIGEEERLRSAVVRFTAYTGERAALNEANRKLVRLLFEKNVVLESYKLGPIRVIATHDKKFYFKVRNLMNTRDMEDTIRSYWYYDYGKYFSMYLSDYDEVITAAMKDRDEKEDLYLFNHELSEIKSFAQDAFSAVERDDWKTFLKKSEDFANVAVALNNKQHKKGGSLLEATCESDDHRIAENEIELFINNWFQTYSTRIEVDSESFNDIELGTINTSKIQYYNRYCAMHKFNEKFYLCEYLPQLVQNVVPPLEETLKNIRKYGAILIPKPNQIVKADFSVLTRSPGHNALNRDSTWYKVHDELKRVDKMEGLEFESYCVSLLKALGYTSVKKTQKSWDYGADIIVSFQDERYVVQCKRHSHLIDFSAVEETCRARDYYNATDGFVMTNQRFTERAVQLAREEKIALWDRDILTVLITLMMSGEVSETKQEKKKRKRKRKNNQ